MLEEARRDKVIGSSLEGAIALTPTADARRPTARRRERAGPGLADLFIVSETVEEAGRRRATAGASRRPTRACGSRSARRAGRRCDRCWKVTPEAEATGLCDRCRAVRRRRRAA